MTSEKTPKTAEEWANDIHGVLEWFPEGTTVDHKEGLAFVREIREEIALMAEKEAEDSAQRLVKDITERTQYNNVTPGCTSGAEYREWTIAIQILRSFAKKIREMP